MAENEKKNSRTRRTPSLEKAGKQADQPLSGAVDAPRVCKISGPKRKPAEKAAQKPEEKQPAQQGRQSRQKKGGKADKAQTEPKEQKTGKSGAKEGVKKPEGGKGRQQRGKRSSIGTAPIAAAQQAQVIKQAAEAAAPARQPAKRGRGTRQKKSAKPAIKAYFLGGLNEIGKNFTLYECQDDMVIVDCGLAFPDEEMLGVDSVIPDFTFVEKNRDKIRGAVITHGHEDHIGAVPYLLKKLNVPVYGTALTIGLIEGKLKEHGLTGTARLQVTPPGSHIQLGCMDVELIHVNHSIADAVALAIHSPAGVVVHTGDFKIDCTPAEGEMIDLARFAELGKEGVLALLADSTNVERPGYTMSEKKVAATFNELFQKASGRVIIAMFASNVHRIQSVVDSSVRFGRKVCLVGRSMVNVSKVAMQLGYLKIPEGKLISALAMLASPATVSGFVMARNMGHEGTLSASAIMLTTFFSAFTLTAWLYLLKSLGLT